ncbi:MAG: right-handed parallel beta-helix repeat-containing protein, partial [Acidobacteriia bacterium]|nr:right-handed parallel beta-helix repeat-containing protein [Terriglobia bacterium]
TNLCLRNLDLTLTDAPAASGGYAGTSYQGAISANYLNNVVLEGLKIGQVADLGVKIEGSSGVRVLGCEFRETGACAVAALKSHDLEFADCRIGYAGFSTPSAAGVLLTGDRIHVHHTSFHDAGYAGIFVDGDKSVVVFNKVWRVMLKMADGSALYTNGTNGLVRRNWASEVGVGPQSRAPAYYLDDNTAGYTIEGNVAIVKNWLLHVHNAAANTIRNNIFVAADDARITFQGASATVLENNVINAGGRIIFDPIQGQMAALRGNLLHSGSGTVDLLGRSAAAPLDLNGNFILKDLAFVDLAHGDVRFRPDAPALKSGIPQPPAPNELGPRPGR